MENLHERFSLGVSSENSKQSGTRGEEGSVRERLGRVCVCVRTRLTSGGSEQTTVACICSDDVGGTCLSVLVWDDSRFHQQ